MLPSDGPPARNSTRATHGARRNQASEPLSASPGEGPKSTALTEERQLISIAGAPGDEIRNAIETPSQGGRNSPPHATPVEEGWEQLERALESLSDLVEQSKVESRRTRREIIDFQDRVYESHKRMDSQICDARQIIARLHMRSEGRPMPSTPPHALRLARQTIARPRMQSEGRLMPSKPPRALASQALYTERRSHEGTAGYERRRSARVHFELPQPSQRARMEGVADNNSSRLTYIEAKEREIGVNSVPAKDAISVELAGAAKRAATTKLGALEPWAEDELHGLNTAPRPSLMARMCVHDTMPWYGSTDGEQTFEMPLVRAATTAGKRKCGLEILPQGTPTKRVKHCRAKDGESQGD